MHYTVSSLYCYFKLHVGSIPTDLFIPKISLSKQPFYRCMANLKVLLSSDNDIIAPMFNPLFF